MRPDEFAHVIAAAAQVTGLDDFVVIGSQAIIGTHPDPPAALTVSMEADIYPQAAPEKADLIDGALGDGSAFHATFGYYAHGVGPDTAKPPAGWQQRLVRVDVPPRAGSSRRPVAWCLEAHDLVLAKCAAGRSRDWQYAEEALRCGVVAADGLLSRVGDLPLPPDRLAHVDKMLRAITERVG